MATSLAGCCTSDIGSDIICRQPPINSSIAGAKAFLFTSQTVDKMVATPIRVVEGNGEKRHEIADDGLVAVFARG